VTTTLAYFPSPPQGVWHLGPIPIRAYALFIIAGIVVALVIGDRRWEARGGERGVIYDIALWAVPFGLIGGRLYHLMTDWRTYFGEGGAGPGAALRIWDGGLGIWGAVALGGVGAWIGCRRRGIPLPAFGDAIAPGIVLAQAIGRLGNYFNQELYGRETTLPWGMEIFYRRDSSGMVDVHSLDGVSTGQVAEVVQPTFLYELLWNVLIFAILIYVDRRFKIGHGRLFALYVAGYCVGRFCVELLRDDTATHIAGIRVNSFTSTFVFIGAVVYMMLAPKGREDPATLRAKTADGEATEETPVSELAEELIAVAAGSGIVAAATVAGEHEDEDAAAVGDLDDGDETDEDTASSAEPEGETAAAEESEAPDEEAEAEQPADEAEAEAPAEANEAADKTAEAEPDQAEPEAEKPVDETEAEPEPEPAEQAALDEAEPAEPQPQTSDESEVEAESLVETSEPEPEPAEPETADESQVEAESPAETTEPDAEAEPAKAELAEPETEVTGEAEAEATSGAEPGEAESTDHDESEPDQAKAEAEEAADAGQPAAEAEPDEAEPAEAQPAEATGDVEPGEAESTEQAEPEPANKAEPVEQAKAEPPEETVDGGAASRVRRWFGRRRR
jgi:prolipoprotein diacylglyceryl transferase